MYEYSKIKSVRRLSQEEFNRLTNYSSCLVDEHVKEFTHVKKGDWVMRLLKEEHMQYPQTLDVYAEDEGYIRYEKQGGPGRKTPGCVLFYITENNNMEPCNWDMSSFRVEKEVIDGKYYYSVYGIPKEPVIDTDDVWCDIQVTDDDPSWEIMCGLSYGISYKKKSDHSVQIQEPFRIKIKNGDKWGNGITTKKIFVKSDAEEDGQYYCIRNIAIGYPKKSHLAQNLQPTKSEQDTNDACFVYVMRNNDNGAYKIGISNNPEYREHTLQSQEPNITCIFQVEFPTREIARAVEASMHLKYKEYHMRGEWFAIPHDMIGQVMVDIAKFK